MPSKAEKQWGGRFRKEVDRLALFYTESISFDWRLYPYDIAGGIAHARMLAECGIIKKGEANKIVKALRQIEKELDKGEFNYEVRLEDIHTNIEAALIEKVGADIGGKLHTGRSRNDQVLVAQRLYEREALDRLATHARDGALARVVAHPHRAEHLPECSNALQPLTDYRCIFTA